MCDSVLEIKNTKSYWFRLLTCSVCGDALSGDKKTICGKKDCKSERARIRYSKNRDNRLLSRPCPCCGKIITNKDDKYCSDMCIINCEGIHNTEEKFIRENKYNIVVLANMARLLPENRKRLNDIQDRLERRYKSKYRYSLPIDVMLNEFGFIEDVDIMSAELYHNKLLTGSSYEEVAYDISIYRKLWDYGVLLDLVE